ncbi:MAG TPA: Mur ligase domain-containing protein, partial [Candidatus Babeliales bacterium]|nr:Mur ligase domain-containing protein [Candidatus Babeliales bacterium]
MHFDKKFFMQAVNHAIFLYDSFPKKIFFSIDSRTLNPGDIFVALKGEKSDGHEFIIQALQKGASGIICAAEG